MNQPSVSQYFTGLLSVGIAFAFGIRAAVGIDPQLDFFEEKIRPVLVTHCYECHSGEAKERGKLKGGLLLDSREGLLVGGEGGPAIVAGNPGSSILMDALRYDGLEMPPKEKLPKEILSDFERWIGEGAYDPREGKAIVVKRGMSIDEGRQFWSFLKPGVDRPPEVQLAGWPAVSIDSFILAKLEANRLAPADDADPRILIRRLYFDLIGLPPTESEVDEFVRSWSADQHSALAATVDRLLASSHFGERWGRHWLDVARYADSNGRDRNVYYYHAWRYRDYVIDSYNRDLPFDQFVREQIAGDLLDYDSREQRDRQLTATGFLALGSKALEEQKPEVFRMDVVDEQIELVGRAVLGLSVGCARCHDHKFDAIPTADYYALAGIFRSSQPLYGYGPKGIKATAFHHTPLQAIGPDAERLGPAGLEYLARLQELTLAQNTARSDRYRIVRRLSATKIDMQGPEADKSKFEADIAKMEAEIKDWDVKVKAHEAALQAAMDNAPAMPDWAMAMSEHSAVEDCKIHLRGDTANLGDVVPRGMLQVISMENCSPIAGGQSGRRELANWLSDRRNPLTARVYVNRIWQHLFGRGIVSTPDDFGVNSSGPSHAELLDYLAERFVDSGWSTKSLLRDLVLSRTYRQGNANTLSTGSGSSSRAESPDPDNVLLSHRRPRRLQAEVLRDAIMQVAETLDRSPPAPNKTFMAKFNPYREDEYRAFQPLFNPTQIEHSSRSVYLPVVRGVLPEVFQLFDFASPDRSTSQRDESIVPTQSLYFMNSPWVIDQAKTLSQRLLLDGDLDNAQRVATVYRRAFSREASPEEVARALKYLSVPELLVADSNGKNSKEPTEDERLLERWTSFCQVIFASAEFRYVK